MISDLDCLTQSIRNWTAEYGNNSFKRREKIKKKKKKERGNAFGAEFLGSCVVALGSCRSFAYVGAV
jgi:hypothetical protein